MGFGLSDPPPQAFGDYELIRRIAVGGTAEIFQARRSGSDSNQPVVLKVLLPQYASDPEYVRMLQDEARVGDVLSHPNLVKLFEFGYVGRQAYIAMELVDGLALSDLLTRLKRRGERLPLGLGLFIVAELLKALTYVHEATDANGTPLQIVHRDVTPHNALISREGKVVLGDFGIARSNMRDCRTRTGIIKGKLRYLAPEQVTNSLMDGRTDLYAVGMILYELATGQPYLQAKDEISLLREAESPRFRRPSEVAGVDGRLDQVVRRALGRFPEERYANARSFLKAVEVLEGELEATAGASELREVVEWVRDDEVDSVEPESRERQPDSGDQRPTRPDTPSGEHARGQADQAADRTTAEGQPDAKTEDRKESASPKQARPWTIGAFLLLGAATVWLGVARSRVSGPQDRATAQSLNWLSTNAPPQDSSASMNPVVLDPPNTSPTQETPLVSSFRPLPRAVLSQAFSPVAGHVGSDAAAVPSAATAEAIAAASASPVSNASLTSRLSAIRTALASRGILLDDLSASQRAGLRAAEQDIAGHRDAEAETRLGELEREVGALRVDGAFVGRKLARVNAAIQALNRAGGDVSSVRALSATALQEYMEGRHAETNARLNEILNRLAGARATTRP